MSLQKTSYNGLLFERKKFTKLYKEAKIFVLL